MPTNDDAVSHPVRSRLAGLRRAVGVPDLGERLAFPALGLVGALGSFVLAFLVGPTEYFPVYVLLVLLVLAGSVCLYFSVMVVRHGRPLVEPPL